MTSHQARRLAACVIVSAICGLAAPPPLLADVAFAWANEPKSKRYTPNQTYSYNEAGGGITISRTGTGRYQVLFRKLGRKGKGGGHVQVSAYGSERAHCRVIQWDYAANDGRDFLARIACTDIESPIDTRFTVLAGWPGGGKGAPSGLRKIPARSLPGGGKADAAADIETLHEAIMVLNSQVNAIRNELNKLAE